MENLVVDYLSMNPGKKLSAKKLSKKLNLKIKHVFYLIKTSPNIRRVGPLEVGSLKHNLSVFTWMD